MWNLGSGSFEFNFKNLCDKIMLDETEGGDDPSN
jgi:hypothetical protein